MPESCIVLLHARLQLAARLQSAFLSMVESGGQHKKEPVHIDINERFASMPSQS